MPKQPNPPPSTQLTITRTDSTIDILPIPSGENYAALVLSIAQGGGYFLTDGVTFVPIYQVKTIVAS